MSSDRANSGGTHSGGTHSGGTHSGGAYSGGAYSGEAAAGTGQATAATPVLRRPSRRGGLDEADLAPTWVEQFTRWYADAGIRLREPSAMVFATADAAGRPSARTVLLKGFDERGFVLFTNYTSRKGREAGENPAGSLVFPWHDLDRQVLVSGTVTTLAEEENAAYFRSRPRGSQLSAWTSHQSSVIASREELEHRHAVLAARWPDEVPPPPFWGGLRIAPVTVEFWQGRPDRLHDRLRYRDDGGRWVVERLAP